MTIIETAKMNGVDPQAYLADVLDRTNDHKINPRRTAAVELGTCGNHPRRGCLMATITYVFTINHVAEMLGEDRELLKAIVSNSDNLT